MARWPDGIAFLVTSQLVPVVLPIVEGLFIVDAANNYAEPQARQEARDLFEQLYEAHVIGTADYRMQRCEEEAHEGRPAL